MMMLVFSQGKKKGGGDACLMIEIKKMSQINYTLTYNPFGCSHVIQ